MLNRTFIIAAVGAALMFCSLQQEANAQRRRLFGRRNAAPPAACPGGVCTVPRAGGLTVNARGGFEGQLPDTYYRQAAPGGRVAVAPQTAVQAGTVAVQTTPRAVVGVQAVLPSVPVLRASTPPTVEQAESRLKKLQEQLAAAELAVRQAGIRSRIEELQEKAKAEAAARIAELEASTKAQVESLSLEAKVRAQEAELEVMLAQLRSKQASLDRKAQVNLVPDLAD